MEAIGYKIAIYPLTLLNVSIKAIRAAPASSQRGGVVDVLDFETLQAAIGFPESYAGEKR